MSAIGQHLERLDVAIRRTSWRLELTEVDPAVVSAAEAEVGPLPADYREFLGRVRALENSAGDVVFLTARDLASSDSVPRREIDRWRRDDLHAARPYEESRSSAEAFWSNVVPVLCSTVNGDDFLAIDRRGSPHCIVEAWGERGWSESARRCANSFTDFLGALADVFEEGPDAFECGWRLTRKAILRQQARDARYREPLVPIVFVTDFDSAAPRRRPTRPSLFLRR